LPSPNLNSMDTNVETLKTADGTPLKKKLQQSLFRNKLRAFGLVSPLLIFLLFLFVLPIALLLWQGVYDPRFSNLMPETSNILEDWDGVSEPTEDMYAALVVDLVNAKKIKQLVRLLHVLTGNFQELVLYLLQLQERHQS
jgi:putative spermidine/putrescine transport system permease protein